MFIYKYKPRHYGWRHFAICEDDFLYYNKFMMYHV